MRAACVLCVAMCDHVCAVPCACGARVPPVVCVPQQVKEIADYMSKHGITTTQFWLDIESSDWGSNHTKNVDFIEHLGAEAAKRIPGTTVGIYTAQWCVAAPHVVLVVGVLHVWLCCSHATQPARAKL